MKRKALFNPILVLSLIVASAVSLIAPPTAVAQTSEEFIINARDFDGVLVTSSPTDIHEWFTWGWPAAGGEAETYEDAVHVFTSVRSNIYPEVTIQAGVPSNTYRLWIYQQDESWDRSLETTVGTDMPVHTTFDATVEGYVWKWLDIGVHTVGMDTILVVKAVGDFINHGQDVPERRGAFRAIYLTTDLGDNPPTFVPDGQTDYFQSTGADLIATPDSPEVYPGDTVAVNLDIQGASDLYAAQALCTVDPAILEPQGGVFGDFFDLVNRLIAANEVDAVAGTWFGAISQQNPAGPLSGNGLFATVTYQALSPGITSVACDPLLSNRDGFTQTVSFTGANVTVLAFGTISGTATYQGRLDHAGIEVTATGIVSNTDTTDSAGAFTLGQLKAYTYTVKADAVSYLPVCATNVVVSSGETVTLTATTLLGGDLNDDDTINIGDATLLTANFGLPVPPADARADINADDIVNVQDLAILGGNYEIAGCQGW